MSRIDVEKMDNLSIIIIAVPNILIILLCVYLIADSIKSSEKFYYKIIRPFFSFIVFFIILFRMVFITSISGTLVIWDSAPNQFRIITKIFDLLFIRNIENMAIYSRLFSIKKELFAYQKKVIKSGNPLVIKYKENHSKKSKISINMNTNFTKCTGFFIQIILLFILLFFCFFPFGDNPFIYSYFKAISPNNSTVFGEVISQKEYEGHDGYGGIIILVYNNFLYLYALGSYLKIIFLKIKEDTFFIRLEFSLLMLIILIENNFGYIFGLCSSDTLKEYTFYILDWSESFYSLGKILILFLVYYFRKNYKSKNKEIIEGTAQFQDFIINNNCFQIFKYYVRHNQETLNYLTFYLDYIEFLSIAEEKKSKENNMKLMYNKNKNINMSKDSSEKLFRQDEALVEKAKDIFTNYFKGSTDTSSFSSNSKKEVTNSLLKTSSQVALDLSANYLIINFPTDIYEDVFNISKANFIVEHLETIYDEAYKWVLVQLNVVYNDFKKETFEMQKVQTMVFFSDYFEEINDDEIFEGGRKLSDGSLNERILPSSYVTGRFTIQQS